MSLPVLLALDTSTEQCSVAVRSGGRTVSRLVPTARGHADMILTMVQEVMAGAGVRFTDIDAIAFGRGPGAFTGVRLAVGVTQGLALARDLPVLPVSDLATIAQQGIARVPVGSTILVCMDARMGEIYTAAFTATEFGIVVPASAEQVCAPQAAPLVTAQLGLGAGFVAYPVLQKRFPGLAFESALPRAEEVARLAEHDYLAGQALPVEQALPVYLRDNVVHVKTVTATGGSGSI
jgi:tRNA threonylcarbamoyladenosine biosynthesis protein TsaB